MIRPGAAVFWCVGLLAFVLPLSTSAVSVCALLLLLLWLVEGSFVDKLSEILSNPVVVTVLAFLLFFSLGLLWSSDWIAGLETLQGSWKIAMLPVFLTAVSYQRRSLCVNLFLAGISLTMLITFLAWFDLIHYADVTPHHLTRKTFHVVYNPLLAFAIYLVLHQAIWEVKQGAARFFLFALAAIMIFNMFITEGRTGQLVFFVLMGLLLFQVFKGNRLKGMLAVCILLPMMFALGYSFSPMFKQRVDVARAEIQGFKKNPNTSVGMRMQFCANSLVIIGEHPWLGVGTGGFKDAYARMNLQRSPYCIATDNPHNQYVLVAAMLGIPGLVLLLLIFVAMFYQAWLVEDQWQRIRFAFPLFFMVIMGAESYLKVYETGFFFALMAAVLYKKKPDERLRQLAAKNREQEDIQNKENKKCWLILSYRANVPNSACSQHIDDRLPYFQAQGIEPVLLTGPVGEQYEEGIHIRTHSLAPSGIRFELRHFLRKHLHKRYQFKLVETLLLLPVFPFYLLEKIIINLESEWSWWFMASIRGFFLCRQLEPEVIYSTGGSASAHLAALLLKKWTGVCWLAETQDPLVHDRDWQRGHLVLRVYTWLEKRICTRADVFIFLVKTAMEHTAARTGTCNGAVIYPGSVPEYFSAHQYQKGEVCRFSHFGSLGGTRNLVVFFKALQRVLAEEEQLPVVEVNLYGSFDSVSRRAMNLLQLEDTVICHGPVSREKALQAMQRADCLLLVQNIIYFSCETIPSKVYEYLLSRRPIIGLLHNNRELEEMLLQNGHYAIPGDEVEPVAGAIRKILARFAQEQLENISLKKEWTTAAAVDELIRKSEINVES